MGGTSVDYWQLGEKVVQLCEQASNSVMEYYHRGSTINISNKADDSPVTEADQCSNELLVNGLQQLLPDCPVLSEEQEIPPFAERRNWQRYWLVDPLDGTREFINRTDEFSINVALIESGRAVLGVIAAPVERIFYLGVPGVGAVRYRSGEREPISVVGESSAALRLLMGRRRINQPFADSFQRLKSTFADIDVVQLGSALKFCRLAEGEGDICTGLFPCYEWDIAAGQALLEAAGGAMVDSHFAPLRYNSRESLISPHFYAFGRLNAEWSDILAPTRAE